MLYAVECCKESCTSYLFNFCKNFMASILCCNLLQLHNYIQCVEAESLKQSFSSSLCVAFSSLHVACNVVAQIGLEHYDELDGFSRAMWSMHKMWSARKTQAVFLNISFNDSLMVDGDNRRMQLNWIFFKVTLELHRHTLFIWIRDTTE